MDSKNLKNVKVGALVPFANHPFKPYAGKRMDELVESIKANGVMSPIIVRSIDGGRYEILAGHNRFEAAKTAGLKNIPAIVRDDLNDEEAEFVVMESNFLQRSMHDMTHSERANALAAHYKAVKQQGRRSDLLRQLEDYIGDENPQDATSRPSGEKIRTDEKTAGLYGLSARNLQRYVRVSYLIKSLQLRLDNGEFPFHAAVEMAYIPENKQVWIADALQELTDAGGYELDTAKAEALRARADDIESDLTLIKAIVRGELPAPNKSQAIRIGRKMLMRHDYFKTYRTPEETERVIDAALTLFFADGKK